MPAALPLPLCPTGLPAGIGCVRCLVRLLIMNIYQLAIAKSTPEEAAKLAQEIGCGSSPPR